MLSYVAGLCVIASGLTSMATGSRVIADNLQAAFGWDQTPDILLAVGVLLLLAGLVFRGMRESMTVNALCTLVEASGLVMIIAVGMRFWGAQDLLEMPSGSVGDSANLLLFAQGAVLTFFAFIGFEDALNVAEEVKNPRINLPIGLLLAMCMATLIYLAVAITAVSVVPWRELAAAPAPLSAVMAKAAPWFPNFGFIAITIFAVANTALINFIMGSRLIYGMARQGLLPSKLGAVHPTRRTPHIAIACLLAVVITLAFLGDISQLAASTVLLLLAVFTLMNLSLIILQRRPGEPKGAFEPPAFVPALGALICFGLLVTRAVTGDWRAPAIAGGLLLGAFLLYLFNRRQILARHRTIQD
jgi:amino acid transporter